ncbi:MAG TPA: Calx-beta domain-containing protein [Verrucomicrobiae bacterium]
MKRFAFQSLFARSARIFSFLACLMAISASAQVTNIHYTCAARLDHSFEPSALIRVPIYVGARAYLEVLADDRIIIGGQLGIQPGVARLLPNGELDPTFEPFQIPHETANYPFLSGIGLLPDSGRIMVSGWISHLNTPLVRLNPNGEVDPSFTLLFEQRPEIGKPWVRALAVDGQGRTYVAGWFTHIDGAFRPGLARLQTSGALDDTFVPAFTNTLQNVTHITPSGTGAFVVVDNNLGKLNSSGERDTNFSFGADLITALFVDSKNRLLVGYNETPGAPTVTRFLPTGEVDPSFAIKNYTFAGIFGEDSIISIAEQSDGRILLGGGFTNEENTAPAIARFFEDGTWDASFLPILEQNGWADDLESVTDIAFQSSGEIIVSGDFDLIDHTERRGVARLFSNTNDCSGILQFATNELQISETDGFANIEVQRSGNLDEPASVFLDFIPGDYDFISAYPGEDYFIGNTRISFAPGESNKVYQLPIVDDGLIETHESVRAILREVTGNLVLIGRSEIRIHIKDDDSIGLPGTPQPVDYGSNLVINAIAVDSISRAIVAGSFTNLAGQPRTNIARLEADGTLAPGFNPAGVPFTVRAVHIIHGYGPILVGGDRGLVRLHPDGSLDQSFNVTIGGETPRVSEILVQPDNKIVLGGKFQTVNGVSRNGLARLHENGQVDESFDPGPGIENLSEWVHEPTGLALQKDGMLLVGGYFNRVAGFQNFALVRLQTNGAPDTTYAPRINHAIGAVLLQDDGKLVIGGDFQEVNGQPRRGLARLNPDGSTDTSFLADAQVDNYQYAVSTLTQFWDGTVYAGGKFSFAGTRGSGDSLFRPGLARFSKDGVIDPLFYTGTGANNAVNTVGLGLDGSVLAGGPFTHFNGELHHGLVRLHGNSPLATGRISFASTGFAANESDPTAQVRFVRQWGTNGTISIQYQTQGGNAIPGADYVPASRTLTFLPGETEKEISIPLINDDQIEIWDSFQVKLHSGPVGLISEAGVAIYDDEFGFVFEQSEYRVTEGDELHVRLLQTGPRTNSGLISLETRAGTALQLADYEYRRVSEMITDDSPTITIKIPILSDAISETAEEFTVEIVDSSAPIRHGPAARIIISDRAEPGFLMNTMQVAEDQLTIDLATQPGRNYNLYVSDDLQNWSFLDRIYAFSTTTQFTDRAPAGTTHRFYKVHEYLPY